MNHTESSIQQACVAAFRAKYPWAAKLLIHVKNEETGGAAAGGIHKAEGVVAGAPDLLLLIPSNYEGSSYSYLGIEMKSEHGRVGDKQLLYGTYISAAGGYYIICRSLELFLIIVDGYMSAVDPNVCEALRLNYRAEDAERIVRARQELRQKTGGTAKPRRKKSVTAAREELQRILA